MSGLNVHGPKDVRAIEVRLYSSHPMISVQGRHCPGSTDALLCLSPKTATQIKISELTFGAKFQTVFVVCFFIITNHRLERRLCVKLKD